MAPISAQLIKFEKISDGMDFVDISGGVKEKRHQSVHGRLPVVWTDYERNQKGDGSFTSFGERIKPHKNPIENPYLKIDFEKIKNAINAEVIDFLVTPNYFSYVLSVPVQGEITNSEGEVVGVLNRKIKRKVSFLRKSSVSEEDFKQKKWFLIDHERHFGIMLTSPQQERTLGETTESEVLAQRKKIRFHTDKKETVIKWHISKNSTTDPFYLEIAREAISIYNRAFQIITQGTDKKIQIVLDETERKDLGDLRHNILNLFDTKELGMVNLMANSILFGAAPSYVNPDTGQIIGATANIILPNLLEQSFFKVKSYTRYEIFQKNKKTEEENKIHVVNPYFKARIEHKCSKLTDFIKQKTEQYSKRQITPETELKDRELLISCAKTIYRQNVLGLILHELGHSFGLSHNYKASVDKENYYHSVAEMKEYFPNLSPWVLEDAMYSEKISNNQKKLFKLSSVMDYLPVMSPFMLPVLGKYDLAALRYLYRDQVENKTGGFIDLNISENVDSQEPLSSAVLSQMKKYLHCPDHLSVLEKRMQIADNFLCVERDYGSNPTEIMTHYMESFQRGFNSGRYRYDNNNFSNLPFLLLSNISDLTLLVSRWQVIKRLHLKEKGLESSWKYSLFDPSIVEDYKFIITNNANSEEYYAYHKIREPLLNFYMDILFMESMKCEVRDSSNRKYIIDLELIRSQFNPDYIEDCYSDSIKKFLGKQGLELIAQRGVENLFEASYHSIESSEKRDDNIFSLQEIQQGFLGVINGLLVPIAMEPDFIAQMKERLEERILEGEYLSGTDLQFTFTVYSSFKNQVINYLNKNFDQRELILSNERYFKSVRFKKGTQGSNSFFQIVEYPMSTGRLVNSLDLPFVEWAYRKYEKTDKSTSFQNYILSLSDSVVDYGDEFIIPFHPSGFVEKVIEKYNKNKKRVEVLEEKSDRTFLEAVELKRKLEYSKFLLDIIK